MLDVIRTLEGPRYARKMHLRPFKTQYINIQQVRYYSDTGSTPASSTNFDILKFSEVYQARMEPALRAFTSIVVYRELLESTRYGTLYGTQHKGSKHEGPKHGKIAKKLTDTEIKSTKPAEKEVNLFDGDGLLLRIAPWRREERKLVFQICSACDQSELR